MNDDYHFIYDDDKVIANPCVPTVFVERNDTTWHGHVQQKIATGTYQHVQEAVNDLSQTVTEDIPANYSIPSLHLFGNKQEARDCQDILKKTGFVTTEF